MCSYVTYVFYPDASAQTLRPRRYGLDRSGQVWTSVVKKLINRLPLSTFKILKYKRPQLIKRSKKRLPMIRLCKLLHEPLQVWIRSDHESSDGDLQLLALCCQINAPV